MGKVIGGLIVIVGIWMGVELMTLGPSRAFGGIFSDLGLGSSSEAEAEEVDSLGTARRAGDSVARARDATESRRAKMLGE